VNHFHTEIDKRQRKDSETMSHSKVLEMHHKNWLR